MAEEGTSGRKQSQISELVHQLKQGQINKNELFQRLADLQSSKPSASAAATQEEGLNASSSSLQQTKARHAASTAQMRRPEEGAIDSSSRSPGFPRSQSASRMSKEKDSYEEKHHSVRTSPIQEQHQPAGLSPNRPSASSSNLSSKTVDERREMIQKLVQEKRKSREQSRPSTAQKEPASELTARGSSPHKDSMQGVSGAQRDSDKASEQVNPGKSEFTPTGSEIASITQSVKQAVSTAVTKRIAEYTDSGSVTRSSPAGDQKIHATRVEATVQDTIATRAPEAPNRPPPPPRLDTSEARRSTVGMTRPMTTTNSGRTTRSVTTPIKGAPSAMQARVEARSARKSFSYRDLHRDPQMSKSFVSTSSSTRSPTGGLPSATKARAEAKASQKETQQTETSDRECTFRPEIHELPPQYGYKQPTPNLPFEVRVTQWKTQKEAEAERKRKEQESEQFQDCTFRPNVSKTSLKLARSRSSGNISPGSAQGGMDVHERLYRSTTPAAHAKSRQEHFHFSESHEHHENGFRSASAPRGRRDSSDEGRRYDPDELAECTFKPRINPDRGSATPVRSRYMQAAAVYATNSRSEQRPPVARRRHSNEKMPVGYEECTFAPRINRVKPEMGSASAYTSSNVYDRLSKAKRNSTSVPKYTPGQSHSLSSRRKETSEQAKDENEEKPIMDMSTFMNALNKESPSQDSGRLQVDELSKEEQTNGRRNSETTLDKEERQRRFQAFLSRQNQAELRKKQHIEQTKQMNEPEYTPNLCRRSIKLAESTKGGSFLDRINRELQRREHENLTKRAAVTRDPECTFQPKINANSRHKPPRSYEELSTGDALKRETTQRLLRLKAEQEELEGLTFKPKLSAASEQAEGRLRVREDPSSYLQRLQRESEMMENKMKERLLQNEAQELAECTFRPEVHDAPTYVKRIAKSMALTRAIQPPSSETSKPEWK